MPTSIQAKCADGEYKRATVDDPCSEEQGTACLEKAGQRELQAAGHSIVPGLTILEHRKQCLADQGDPGVTVEIKLLTRCREVPGGSCLRSLELKLASLEFL